MEAPRPESSPDPAAEAMAALGVAERPGAERAPAAPGAAVTLPCAACGRPVDVVESEHRCTFCGHVQRLPAVIVEGDAAHRRHVAAIEQTAAAIRRSSPWWTRSDAWSTVLVTVAGTIVIESVLLGVLPRLPEWRGPLLAVALLLPLVGFAACRTAFWLADAAQRRVTLPDDPCEPMRLLRPCAACGAPCDIDPRTAEDTCGRCGATLVLDAAARRAALHALDAHHRARHGMAYTAARRLLARIGLAPPHDLE